MNLACHKAIYITGILAAGALPWLTARAADRDVVVIERPIGANVPEVDIAGLVPANLYERFRDIEQMLRIVREAYTELAKQGFDLPNETVRTIDYRLGLISRYLKMHELFENQRPVLLPEPRDPLKPGPTPLDREHLYAIANAYIALLQEKPPTATATVWAGVKWQDTAGSPIYFATEHEGEVLRRVLSFEQIADQRARIRRRLMILVDLTLGVTNLLPGGAIPELAFITTTGETIQGAQVGFWGRVLAVGGIGLELLPVAIPVVKASMAASSRALSTNTQRELVRYLADRSTLRSRVNATRVGAAREQIQADWFRNFDALQERKTSGIPISVEPKAADGVVGPVRGIDYYAYPSRSGSAAPGIVRELKVKEDFSGKWTASSTSLGSVKTSSLANQQIRDAVAQIGRVGEIDQLSWPWVLDRAISGHRLAKESLRKATTNAARASALQQATAAEDLIRRFAEGRLTRQLCIMTKEAEMHVRASTLLGQQSGGLNGVIDDVVPVSLLQKIARDYLAAPAK